MIDLRKLFPVVPLLSAAVLLMAPGLSSAQWMWKDDAGHVIASDQAPPPGTPQSRIMKAPRQRAAGSQAAALPGPADVAKADPPKSVADRELDARLKQKEQADAARKADEDANKLQAMKENCASVRSNIVALQSGGRAARFNAQGEKVYIGDDERQAEIAKQQAQANQYCKS